MIYQLHDNKIYLSCTNYMTINTFTYKHFLAYQTGKIISKFETINAVNHFGELQSCIDKSGQIRLCCYQKGCISNETVSGSCHIIKMSKYFSRIRNVVSYLHDKLYFENQGKSKFH